ncbi:MAG TPA: ATPase P [Lachnospiraceae bacterium]|nr:ATPase P [Lachnospiraceae bacterium]
MVKTTAKVDGMMCPMCESHVNDMIRKNFNVKKVSSSHKKKEAYIVSERPLTREELEESLSTLGYHCLEVSSEPYKKGLFGLFG